MASFQEKGIQYETYDWIHLILDCDRYDPDVLYQKWHHRHLNYFALLDPRL